MEFEEDVDHLAWAEAAAAQLDRQVRLDKDNPAVVAAQGQLHATIALVEVMERISDLIEAGSPPPRPPFPPDEVPYPGP